MESIQRAPFLLFYRLLYERVAVEKKYPRQTLCIIGSHIFFFQTFLPFFFFFLKKKRMPRKAEKKIWVHPKEYRPTFLTSLFIYGGKKIVQRVAIAPTRGKKTPSKVGAP
jgi:hypothetical protein